MRCDTSLSIASAAQVLSSGKTEVLAIVDDQQRPQALLTSGMFVDWLAGGGSNPSASVSTLATAAPLIFGPRATATDGLLAMATSNARSLAITDSGARDGRLQAVVSTHDLDAVFGDRPVSLLRDLRLAATTQALRDANHHVRNFTLRHLTSAASVDWLAPFTHHADAAIVRRLVELAGEEGLQACWCFSGSAGRAESLTRLAPQLVLILDDGEESGEDAARVSPRGRDVGGV